MRVTLSLAARFATGG